MDLVSKTMNFALMMRLKMQVGVTYIVVGCFGALAYHERDEGGAEPRRYVLIDMLSVLVCKHAGD